VLVAPLAAVGGTMFIVAVHVAGVALASRKECVSQSARQVPGSDTKVEESGREVA